MKHLKTAAFLAMTLTLGVAYSQSCKCSDAKACPKSCVKANTTANGFFIKDNDSVVFLGDSITQQKLYTTYIEAYTLTRFPEYNLTFRNSGWGGDTAWLRKRWKTDEGKLFSATGELLEKMVTEAVNKGLERDILPLKPTAVTVNFGMNDHSYQAFRPDIFRAYKRSQEEIVRTLKKNGARVALLTPQPIEDMKKDPKTDPRNQSLCKFSDGLKEIAAAEGAEFADQFTPFMEMICKRTEGQSKTIGEGDAVHPGPCGHTVMAWAILKELQAPAMVSAAVIDTSVKWYEFLTKKVVTKNCTVSNFSYKDGILSFDRLDNALPMPIDKRALNALKLEKITCDLNRYPICVKGLADGEYDILIDGKSVVKITSTEGKACTNLAKVATPASAQADKILTLVFKKNEVYFNRWRNVQLKGGDAAKLAELDKQIADFEKQINVLRKPVVHHFEIKPVK
ncbi:MAG: SGNH/GDSL hydrolase family protein [Kiritimatiellae bacterium]|jgi:lysophospholipase L1-like esterase|nr:SGNH/GDSL hydrolase family protein [Kiritimatiellia bacterium]